MKPLTKKQRSISIAILGIIFVVLAPLIVFYSFGYRFDTGFILQKTGGIFIHSSLPNTSVFLNDEYVKDNGIFVRNILIQDLSPNKTYSIRVQKEGYQSWVKDMLVYPSIVSEGRALMLPEQYVAREIFPFVDSEGNGTYTPTKKGMLPTNEEYIEYTKLFDVSTIKKEAELKSNKSVSTSINNEEIEPIEVKSKLDLFFESINIEDQTELKNLIINGKEVSWLTDEGIILYWTDEKSITPYYYCSGLERECYPKIELPWNDIKRFDYFPGRNDVWITLTSTGIFAVEVDGRAERNVQKIFMGDNLDFRIIEDGRLIIKNKSSFFEINL